MDQRHLHIFRILMTLPDMPQASHAELLEGTIKVIRKLTPGSNHLYMLCDDILVHYAEEFRKAEVN